MSPEAVAGVSSAVIALCALGFTIWQAVITRRHNVLSVQPHLTTWSHSNHDERVYSIELINNGIGPALIKSFSVQVDGKPMPGEGTEPLEKALRVLFSNYAYKSFQSYVAAGYMMAAKERRILLQIEFNRDNAPSSDVVDHAIRRSRLVIDYASIYGVTFTLNTDELPSNMAL